MACWSASGVADSVRKSWLLALVVFWVAWFEAKYALSHPSSRRARMRADVAERAALRAVLQPEGARGGDEGQPLITANGWLSQSSLQDHALSP